MKALVVCQHQAQARAFAEPHHLQNVQKNLGGEKHQMGFCQWLPHFPSWSSPFASCQILDPATDEAAGHVSTRAHAQMQGCH